MIIRLIIRVSNKEIKGGLEGLLQFGNLSKLEKVQASEFWTLKEPTNLLEVTETEKMTPVNAMM